MKLNRTKILFVALVFFNSSKLISQEGTSVRMEMPAGGFEFADRSDRAVMPFKMVDGLIVVPVELNGITLNLILDSGMPFDGALLFGSDKVDAAQLTFTSKIPVSGVDGNPILSDISLGATLKVPNLTLTNQMIVVLPRDAERSRQFEGMDGIIGFSFFNHLTVSINYERQYMIVCKPGAADCGKAGQAIPVEVRGNRIFVKAAVQLENGATVPGEFVVDTGNRNALMLNSGRNDNLVLPAKNVAYYTRGLSGKINRQMGRISSVTLGDFRLDNVLASFSDGRSGTPPWEKEGNIGNPILSRFHLTFNLPENKIYLAKNELFNEPFDFDLAGLQVERAADKNLVVSNVISGSPAEKAGVVIGDKILKVNKTPCPEMSRDDFTNQFKKNAKKISVLLERSGKKLTISLKPGRYI